MGQPLTLRRDPDYEDDYEVLENDTVVGHIFFVPATRRQWMWKLSFDHRKERTPSHGYAESREAAMAAFAKSWRRQ
jgi:predicted RNA-binding protein with PUA domain